MFTLTHSHSHTSHTSHRSNLETIESPERGMEESPLPETPPPGNHVTTAIMQDNVTVAGAHVTSHTVTVAGSEPSQLADEAEHVMSGEDAGRMEEDEAEQRERERIRIKEEETAKQCQVCIYIISLTHI